MNYVVTIIAAVVATFSGGFSAYLVYRVSSRTARVAEVGQEFTHQQDTIDGLRADVAELETERRLYFTENINLRRYNERLRVWGYSLARLLFDNGISDIPPEPEEAQ